MSTVSIMDANEMKRRGDKLSQFEISKRIYSSGILSRVDLSMSAKLVLIALTNHYNPQKCGMFPSQKFVAEQLGVSLKSVERAVKELKNANLLVYVTKKVNCYYFTAKFFDEIKMSDHIGQNDGHEIGQNDALTYKHEQKNNSDFQKNYGERKAKTYGTQQKGIDYQPAKIDCRRDEQTPWNDFEVACNFVDSLKDSLSNVFIRQKVEAICDHWKSQGKDFDLPALQAF